MFRADETECGEQCHRQKQFPAAYRDSLHVQLLRQLGELGQQGQLIQNERLLFQQGPFAALRLLDTWRRLRARMKF
jgi:hypothetical protein